MLCNAVSLGIPPHEEHMGAESPYTAMKIPLHTEEFILKSHKLGVPSTGGCLIGVLPAKPQTAYLPPPLTQALELVESHPVMASICQNHEIGGLIGVPQQTSLEVLLFLVL